MTLLLLAGTGEAVRLAKEIAAAGIPAVASLAGATRAPKPLGLPTRTGGWGGEAAFRDWLEAEGITAILDATHPFAARISARTQAVARATGRPYLQLLRPEWRPEPGDDWTMLDREEDVAAYVPAGAVVFLATGRQTLDRFANLEGRTVYCRQIDPPDTPFPFTGGQFIVNRPPFSVEDEEALFRKLRVDWLIVKNAGGEVPKTKLTAARNLGIRVGMLRRPPPAGGDVVQTVDAAMDWVREQWKNG